MRAAIYARVSSAAQRDAHTIESQLHVLRRFVEGQGWALVDTYVDDGRSAKTGQLERRDGFARLMADAEAGKIDILVVLDVNRLTRTGSIEERAQILGPFQRLGVSVATPSGGVLDLRSFLGEFWITVQALVAAEENRKRASAIMAGKQRAIAEGRKPAGPTPYGWTYTRATGAWSLDAAAAAIVREIYRRVIGGESCGSIADDLHDRGVRPPRHQWTRHTVWQIVRKRTAIGLWTADKAARATLQIPPIVDETTWQAAQRALLAHGKRGLVKARHVYLLQGLATCGLCGEPISIRSPTPQRPALAAYICRARKLDLRYAARCPSPIVPTAEIDARVWSIVSRALASDQLAAAVARRFAERDENRRDWQADVKRYEARLAQIDRASAAIMARFRRGAISETALDLELAAAGRDRAAVATQLDAARDGAKAPVVPQVSATEWLGALRDLAVSTSPEDRQRVVRALVRGAVFVEGDVEIDLEIEEPAAIFPAVAAGYRSHHGTIRLRLVAKSA